MRPTYDKNWRALQPGELERRRFFGAFNERWSELREDSTAWPEIEGERLTEEGALRDGGT